ncbi:glycosyl transferase family 2 [Leptolyngbya sp. BL0902]|uniref:glycosyltransferase family 2 protein n=1 Tax=Leptolyngbya sp. BL0902 TaxID=1115757 RepID=UPI0018E8E385|nr:glycosyltransferase family 2 protein [Leptolyngbya sp. BL0902]QQE67143.1 glycosyl transferase family 2 [Leptolyngbya sp. BL0902]
MNTPLLVSICISTYKRPEKLATLLMSLNSLTFDELDPPNIEIIVVDNDGYGSAAAVCENMASYLRWPLKYDIEPVQGVSYARNRSINNASDFSDFIAMIDDDEVPHPAWLERLLIVQNQYCADVVTGPVFPIFEASVPKWIKKGNFFAPKSYQTGQTLETAFTGNVLVRTRELKKLDRVFDERFAIKGAEDTHLFMRLKADGCKIVWANEAVADEWIPSSRTNLKWILRRGYWGWSSYSLFEKEIYPSLKIQLIRLLKGFALMVSGVVLIIPSLFQERDKLAAALLNISRGFGTVSGLLGFQGDW